MRRYLRFKLSSRDLVQMMAGRGIVLAHTTILRWANPGGSTTLTTTSFSFSPPKRFDLGCYRSDERPIPSETFDAPGLVTLRCEIHERMRGLILVLPTPYFTKTDPDGYFRLGGLPPGALHAQGMVGQHNDPGATG